MISISLLSIKDNIEKILMVDKLNSNYIHLDIMDGEFVENRVEFLELPNLQTPKDLHLMVYDIKEYIDRYKKYEPEYITFHVEATDNVDDIINYIRGLGSKVGISIKPNTPVSSLLPYLDRVDLVLVMSVEPGKGGQKFMEQATDKINELYNLRQEYNYHYLIEVDGGVNNITKEQCKNADILVVGSYITLSNDYQEFLNNMIN